jgi:hypothetical protein
MLSTKITPCYFHFRLDPQRRAIVLDENAAINKKAKAYLSTIQNDDNNSNAEQSVVIPFIDKSDNTTLDRVQSYSLFDGAQYKYIESQGARLLNRLTPFLRILILMTHFFISEGSYG